MRLNFNNKKNGGFLVLTMVLLVSAVVLAIATGMMLRSLSEIGESADSEKSLQAWSAVTACGEYALGQMVASTTSTSTTAQNWIYPGGQPLSVPLPAGDETCYIYGVTASGTAKIIKASSTVSQFTRKILIEVATNSPRIAVNSWTYVDDF